MIRIAVVLLMAVAPLARAADHADLVLTGGAVYTMDAARSWAQAVAVKKGRIVYVGNDTGAQRFVGKKTRVVRLEGRMVLPGFQDSHVHPVSGGVEKGQCSLHDLTTKEEILDKVRECAGKPGAWVVGGGWSLSAFPGGMPTRDLLDAIVPDRPVFLNSVDDHSAWVNSKALERAGITAATPDPPNGRIERDPATGEPNGTLTEEADLLVEPFLPPASSAEYLAGLRRSTEMLNRYGITGIYEANTGDGPKGGGPLILDAYRDADRMGLLSLRVRLSLGTDPLLGPEQVDELVALRKKYASRHVSPAAAKIFVDGVLESRTGAMLEPYDDRPGDRGTTQLEDAAMKALVARLVDAGFAVHVHAIGDRAIRMSLDAFEAVRAKSAAGGLRHQIVHLEVIDPADVPRFRELGVIANFEPLWSHADAYIRDLTWPGIGPERSKRLYPTGDLVRAGAMVSFGSDWSVSTANPLEGIQVAVTRQAVDPKDRLEPMLPEQAVDLPTALAAYTMGSAYAHGLESETGSLEAGKSADLVVLSDNLFALDPHDIAKARVLLTLFEGRPVHRDPSIPW